MTDFVALLKRISETVSTALAGPVVPAVIEIGKDVIALIDKSKEIVDIKSAEELQVIRDELEPKVMAHADRTEHTLRGS